MIRLGIIGASPGASWAFTAHVPAIASLADVRISAVATTREASAREAAARVGAEEWFTDAQALAASDKVDAVAVVVKVPAHERAVLAALNAGKPVYCEWPLALDAEVAQQWASAAGERKLPTAIGLQALRSPAVERLAAVIASGSLGEIRAIEAHACRSRGLASRPVTASGSYTLDARNAAGTREVLGGHLVGLVDHLAEIEALCGRGLAPFPDTLADDTGAVHKVTAGDTFVACGRLRGGGLVSISWWDRDPVPRVRLVVHGTRGTAELGTPDGVPPGQLQPQMAPLRLVVTFSDGAVEVLEPPPSSLPLAAQNVAATYRCFLDDIRNGTCKSAQFAQAAHVHELLDAGFPRTF